MCFSPISQASPASPSPSSRSSTHSPTLQEINGGERTRKRKSSDASPSPAGLDIPATAYSDAAFATVGSPEKAARPLDCSPKSWPLLLHLASGRCHTYPDLCRAAQVSLSTVTRFAIRLRASGMAEPGIGMPVIDFKHPAVQAELRKIHALLQPNTARTPLPEHPWPENDGISSYLGFLAMQPPDEWFSSADLTRYFDCTGRTFRPGDCLRQDAMRGRVETCCVLDSRYYRLPLQYRTWIAECAAKVPWATLLPDLKPPRTVEYREPAGSRNPFSPVQLPTMVGHLESRGVPASAPSDPGLAQDFLASRGFRYAPLFTAGEALSARQVLQALNSQAHTRAVVCMPGQPAYLEAVKMIDMWWVRPLIGGTDGRPLRQLADCLTADFLQQAASVDGLPGRSKLRVIVFSD